MDPDLNPTTLYRFYDSAGVLLYVGITKNGRGRWYHHSLDKAWWPQVVGATVEHFPTRTTALEAERAAIIAERPLHNVVHNAAARDGAIPCPACIPPSGLRLMEPAGRGDER